MATQNQQQPFESKDPKGDSYEMNQIQLEDAKAAVKQSQHLMAAIEAREAGANTSPGAKGRAVKKNFFVSVKEQMAVMLKRNTILQA